MRKIIGYFVALTIITLTFISCSPEEPTFDEGLLLGKWKSTTKNEYYRYLSNYTGRMWNEDEDVHETDEDVTKFNWSLEKSDLTHIYISFMTGEELVPKYYKVTELTSTSLKYKDDFGKTFSYKKVED